MSDKNNHITMSIREKCPNTDFFLVRIFPYSDRIRRDTPYLSVFSPNVGKYRPEKTPCLDTFDAVNNFRTCLNTFDILRHINSILDGILMRVLSKQKPSSFTVGIVGYILMSISVSIRFRSSFK